MSKCSHGGRLTESPLFVENGMGQAGCMGWYGPKAIQSLTPR